MSSSDTRKTTEETALLLSQDELFGLELVSGFTRSDPQDISLRVFKKGQERMQYKLTFSQVFTVLYVTAIPKDV